MLDDRNREISRVPYTLFRSLIIAPRTHHRFRREVAFVILRSHRSPEPRASLVRFASSIVSVRASKLTNSSKLPRVCLVASDVLRKTPVGYIRPDSTGDG